jgi:hypothetical protein
MQTKFKQWHTDKTDLADSNRFPRLLIRKSVSIRSNRYNPCANLYFGISYR